MPRLFGMVLSFHPSNEHESNHNPNHVPNTTRNDRSKSNHRSHRNHSRHMTRSPAPQTDHERISNRNDRHRPSDRSHTTHPSSTTRSPNPHVRPHPQDLSISDFDPDSNSEHDHAPETALALHDPRKAQPQTKTQSLTPPQPNIRRGTFHAPNPYGDGELRGEWMHIQSRNPDTHHRRGYRNADVESDMGRRLASGENENPSSRPQERGFKSQAHIPNAALSRRQDRTYDVGTPHDDRRIPQRTDSTNVNYSARSFVESAIFTEHILTTTTDPETGQQQRKRSGGVAVSFWKRDSGKIEGGGVRVVW